MTTTSLLAAKTPAEVLHAEARGWPGGRQFSRGALSDEHAVGGQEPYRNIRGAASCAFVAAGGPRLADRQRHVNAGP